MKKYFGKYDRINNFYDIIWDESISRIVIEFVPLEKYPLYLKPMIKKFDNGGHAATIHGESQEKMIQSALDSIIRRHPKIHYIKPRADYRSKPEKIFLQDEFGMIINPDFVVYELPRFPIGLIIESKFQSVSGTGDEKLEHLLENITRYYPCPTVVVATYEAGRDAKPGVQRKFDIAMSRFKRNIDEYHNHGGNKIIEVMSLAQLIRWINTEAEK